MSLPDRFEEQMKRDVSLLKTIREIENMKDSEVIRLYKIYCGEMLNAGWLPVADNAGNFQEWLTTSPLEKFKIGGWYS